MSNLSSYDVVIIGSGMGGLACANLLLQEGKSVIVLERNRQVGGNLQMFSRDKRFFDTGVHYIGGVDKGQVLHQLFTYFGIIDKLRLMRMDSEGFDHIRFSDDPIVYKFGIGYDNFIAQLLQIFPEEEIAIRTYCKSIQHVVTNLPLAQLMEDNLEMTSQIDFKLNAKEYINSLTENRTLQKVFAGNNALYAASEQTPFYVHALVLHYYIESSYKGINGFGQIAVQMAKKIRELGGTIKTKNEVIAAKYGSDGKVSAVILENNTEIQGEHFISNVHPHVTLKIFGEDHFPHSYVKRIANLQNSEGMFVLHVALKRKRLRYKNYNVFQVNTDNPWDLSYTKENWPNFFMISIPPNSNDPEYAQSLSVICAMRWQEVEKWSKTYNNEIKCQSRGINYEAFKEEKSQILIDELEKHIPEIRSMILSYTSSTPLTQRDYTLSPEGSGYGIAKNSNEPFKTMINTRTAIPNLYLTGQNITLHGILGVSLTAILTAGNIVNKTQLLRKIKGVYHSE
jgi:all-trans-retinol 13,14-reductase